MSCNFSGESVLKPSALYLHHVCRHDFLAPITVSDYPAQLWWLGSGLIPARINNNMAANIALSLRALKILNQCNEIIIIDLLTLFVLPNWYIWPTRAC